MWHKSFEERWEQGRYTTSQQQFPCTHCHSSGFPSSGAVSAALTPHSLFACHETPSRAQPPLASQAILGLDPSLR